MAGMRFRKTVSRESWLLTFNDLITLVFTFFVLLLVFSTLQAEKVSLVSTSVARAFGLTVKEGGVPVRVFDPFVQPYTDQDIVAEKLKGGDPLRQTESWKSGIMNGLEKMLGQENGVSITAAENHVIIRFAEPKLFLQDSSELSPEARGLLEGVAGPLRNMDLRIRIESHMSGVISEGRLPGSGEAMSIRRAATVVQFLILQGGIAADRLSAMGYGDVKPLVGTEDHRREAMDTRTDLIIGYF